MTIIKTAIKFLAIDDENYVRHLYGRLTDKINHIFYFFGQNAQKEISITTQEQPQLNTLDLNMPGMGVENLISQLHYTSPKCQM